jgi:hypothetical protein
MKRDSYTLTHESPELNSIKIAITERLDEFNIETILTAPATSHINNLVRAYNRLDNLSNGSDVEYAINRLPGCLAHKATFAQSHMMCGGR